MARAKPRVEKSVGPDSQSVPGSLNPDGDEKCYVVIQPQIAQTRLPRWVRELSPGAPHLCCNLARRVSGWEWEKTWWGLGDLMWLSSGMGTLLSRGNPPLSGTSLSIIRTILPL